VIEEQTKYDLNNSEQNREQDQRINDTTN
jgi:hypothetical protein